MIRIVASIVFLLLMTSYAGPSIIAIVRGHKRWPLVVAINMLFGWAIIGWFIALAMALEFRLPKRRLPGKTRLSRPPIAPPVANSMTIGRPTAIREQIEPPQTRDESYMQWLDDGAGMNA